MANEQLNAFLDRAPLPDIPPQEPAAAAEPVEAERPELATSTEPASQPASEAASSDPQVKPKEDDDNAEPPAPQEGEAVVPRRALEDERHKRQDWKEQAIRAQTERDALQKQLDEAKRLAAQPPPQPQPQYQPPPQPPPQIPNPAIDPVGYNNFVQQELTKREINARLNQSEMIMRDKIGDEAVEGIIAEFQKARAEDPSLDQKLYQQVHPYQWAANYVETRRMHREIESDPSSYKAFVEWKAQQAAGSLTPNGNGNGNGAAAPRGVPAMAPSLATARSVAGRSAPAFTGPPSLEDIFRRS